MARLVNNDRGLGTYIEDKDTNGDAFRVQDSSMADDPCVWIITKQVTGHHHVTKMAMHAALHLDIDGARRLRDALDDFISHAADERGYPMSAVEGAP